ncbi:hypothetical protein NPIL_662971 [Nephila pilipes]|uniref:Uncharacterized protein n=1 Tax=Nephila pilipes TaxID=299642 RepID=A0A8X6PQP2_NEPPI|nr:hypothetical protein NPIL_662971 [Nephila pilipes]
MKLLTCLPGKVAHSPLLLPPKCEFLRFTSYFGKYIHHLEDTLEHAWYASESPGLSLQCSCPKRAQTTLSKLSTGHIKSIILTETRRLELFAVVPPLFLLHIT